MGNGYWHSGRAVVISSAYPLAPGSTNPSANSLPNSRLSVADRQTMHDACSVTTCASSGRLCIDISEMSS